MTAGVQGKPRFEKDQEYSGKYPLNWRKTTFRGVSNGRNADYMRASATFRISH